MRSICKTIAPAFLLLMVIQTQAQPSGSLKARNPVIFADVPDMSVIRNGDTYYMSSTTMHMSPGVPLMKSKDLVNWELVSYAYDKLDETDALNLENGKNAYGGGSWASSLHFHKGVYYVSTFAGTTGKTYIYTTRDIEKGPWKKISFKPSLHDHSLYFDEAGKIYMVYGAGKIMMAELEEDLSGIKQGTVPTVLIENASAPAGPNIGLPAEGSQLFKINGRFYLFNICWPRGGMRTVIIHRADKLEGPWEGRVALQDKGVAQGGLISTQEGNWYAYLFRDYGAVGRIPYWVPVKWETGWPVLGIDGKVPEELDLPASKGPDPGIVIPDEFTRKKGAPALPLAWQWNHNPDNRYWSVSKRPGYLRIITSRTDTSLMQVRNILTQRCFGPRSGASTAIDVSQMKDGDCAGLVLLQKKFGWIGVKMENGKKYLVMVSAESGAPLEIQRQPLKKTVIHLRADCNFEDRKDTARFYYSEDGQHWLPLGGALKMSYTIPHFMGYRFGLFNYATRTTGGYTDFDYFHLHKEPVQ
jgi:beta-xylosidase